MSRNYVIGKNVGLTNYNKGSDTRAILESVSDIASMLGLDFLEAIRQAIPIMLYKPLGFERKPASGSSGDLRFYRLPVFYFQYSGVDPSVKLNITALQLTLTTSGTPADNVTVDFSVFTTIAAVVAEIDSKTNWSATQVKNGAVNDLYLYSNFEVVGNTNFRLLTNCADVMYLSALNVVIPAGIQISVDSKLFYGSVASNIGAGLATSLVVPAVSIQKGITSNIEAGSIDTENGNGVITTFVAGVEHVINDAAFENGSDEETDEERATRFIGYVNGLHGGTKAGIEKDVMEIPGIKSTRLIPLYPRDGMNTIIADDGTGNLSGALIAEIDKTLDGDINDFENYPGRGVAGIKYNISAPTAVTIEISATLFRIGDTSDEDEMKDATEKNIKKYINTSKSGADVVVAEVIALGKKSHSATYDFVITLLKKNGNSVPVSTNISILDWEVARISIVTLTVVTYNIIP